MRASSLLAFTLLSLVLLPSLAAQGTSPWQMRVAYDMDIVVDAPAHRFTGTQRLTLTNESPDALTYVYYHLYFNAFTPTSLMAERNRHLPDPDGRVVPRIFELGPDEVGYHRVGSLTQDGTPIAFRVEDTLLRAELARPIPPGGSATFEMTFDSQVPLQTRRSGRDSREGIDFSMSQWYPKMAYYDSRGWHADPYVGREFYAPFGTFDVKIEMPAEYVLGATGVLQNPDAIGHGYSDREVAHAPGTRLTWHFKAENVHDFAWAADPDYVHDRIAGPNGVTFHLLYQPDVSEGWQFLRRFVPAVIEYFSDRIGPYVWPQFTVAQAGDGGMEYPMINFITGGRTANSLIGVTAHEAAHEWFYGMIGTNESDYPWMDEGFTSFMTSEAITAILAPGRETSHTGATRSIMALKENDLFEPLNHASDWFETNRAYGTASYAGGEMVLELLGYVIGDEVRDAFIKEYYNQYLLRHPQPADVERVAEQVSGIELDWFFRQLTEQDVDMDYAVAGVAGTTVTLRRNGQMVFPLDLKLTYADGSEQWVTIPTSEMMQPKSVPQDWVVAPAWGWTRPTYTLTVDGGTIRQAEIDPLGRTPDRNRLNNSNRTPREVAFLEAPSPSLDHYSYGWRPLLTYADRFGAGVGVQLRGTYWMGQHMKKAMLTVYPQAFDREALAAKQISEIPLSNVPRRQWYDAIDYGLHYETPVRALSPQTRIALSAEKHLGIMQNRVEVSHTLGRWAALGQGRGTVTLYGVHTLQPTLRGFAFDGLSSFFGDHAAYAGARLNAGRGSDRVEVDVQVGGSLRRNTFDFTDVNGNVTPDFALERFSNTRVTLKAQKDVAAGPLTLRARTLLGFGSDALAPYQRYRMGAVTLEHMWQTAAARQVAGLDYDLADEVPFQAFSGFGPVGYAIPLPPFTPGNVAGNTPSTTQAWMGTLEVGLPRLTTPLLTPLDITAFTGAGIGAGGTYINTGTQRFTLDNLVADAGVGLTYDVSRNAQLRRFTAQSDFLQSLKIAARFPLWLSDPERIGPDEDAFAFRYLFGIEVGW